MNRLTLALLGSVALLGFASSSYAADLIVETPVVEPGIVNVSGNWDGGFVGVFAGHGWGTADHIPATPVDGNDIDLDGWFVGVNAGFNFTVGSNLVVGVVGDIAWADISGSTTDVTVPFAGAYDEITHQIDWQGSLRGRVGFDGGAFMPYLTGGLAFAHGVRETFGPDDGPFDNTHIGWTVGAGVEFAATEDLSIDVLYRFSDYGSEVYNDTGDVPEVALTTHTLQVGLNWHF
jgi:outer membrane immunogenic protein